MTSPLEDVLRSGRNRRGLCSICDSPSVAQVGVRITELDANGRVSKGARSNSRTRQFCAVHAAEIFSALRDDLENRS